MPWWALIYLILFVAVVAVATREDIRDGERVRFIIFDSVAAVIFAYLLAAFWVHQLREAVGWFAPIAFILAIGWEIADMPRGLRQVRGDSELTEMEKRFLLVGGFIFCLPAYVIAGISAFR